MDALEVFSISPVVPVIALENADDALDLAHALYDGGIKIMEVTLRTEAGLKSIEKIAREFSDMHVGAGTVCNYWQLSHAKNAGAKFVFSPGISEELINASKQRRIPFIPGVASASDIMLALNNNILACKLFPATVVGGVDALKAFGGPFSDMLFCPTGGITPENMASFLACKNVACVGGSWLTPKELVEKKDFKQITLLAKEAIDVAQLSR